MYINRALVLLMGLAFVFYPSITEWVTSGETTWYRPYQIWLVVVVAAFWNQRARFSDDL